MTSSNGSIFRVTGPLCGEFTGVTGEFPAQTPVTRSFDIFNLICTWINEWVNDREAGDLRRHRAHCDVIVMVDHDTWRHMTALGYNELLKLVCCEFVFNHNAKAIQWNFDHN